MANRGAFYLFLAGTLSSLVLFLALTIDTHRQVGALTNADRLSEQVVAGKHVWEDKNCNECHTILGFGIYYAPDLTRVYSRIGPEGIKAVVTEPETIFADSIRKMPQPNMSDQEKEDLVAFFQWVNDIDNHDWPPQDSAEKRAERRVSAAFGVSAGAAIFSQKCIGCHSLAGDGGSIGGPLDDVGGRMDAGTLERMITDPDAVKPGSPMPPTTGLSDGDLEALVDFLSKQQEGR